MPPSASPVEIDVLDHADVPTPPDGRRRRHAYQRAADERVNRLASIPFALIHVLAFAGLFLFGVTPEALVLLVVLFVGRMWFITAGYHRYFAHRSYRTNRVFQFILAFGGSSAAQKGPLWWAGHHRDHHRYSDTEQDIHSPLRGFWWSHLGWILCDKYNEVPYERIKDFAKYPEIRFIDKYNWIAPWTLGIASFLIAGLPGLFTGFFLSTVLLWHSTFLVNSLAHVVGRRRYATEDTSRNNVLIAVVTMGEGWHNNHHHHQASARNGFFWWEWDPTYYVLKGLSFVGIVRDLKVPNRNLLYSNWIKHGTFDIGTFKANWARAAAAVHNTQAAIGSRVRERRVAAGEALTHRREVVESAMHDKKEALEVFVHSSLTSAEELAQLSRRRTRDLGLSES
jgi:stearoyl-CoA desaturase (Delta-9 desaturase)